MARRRYISTEISLDREVNQLATEYGDFAALLYTWMIPHAGDDCKLTRDAGELLVTVCPWRRDKTEEDVEYAIQGMLKLGLILENPDKKTIYFPPESFYKYQSYISQDKRLQVQKTPNSAKLRKTPKNTVSPSLSPSPSPSPSDKYIYSDSGQQETESTPQLQIFNHWNSKEIIKHKTLDDKTKRAINGTLNNKHTPEEIMQAIDNYHVILTGDEYYFSYKWTLKDFLNRGLEKFIDFETAANNYKDKPRSRAAPRAPDKRRISRVDTRDWENI